MKQRFQGLCTAWLLATLLVTMLAAPVSAQDSAPRPGGEAPVATTQVTAEGIAWVPQVSYPYTDIVVTVTDPAGQVQRYEFAAGVTPTLPLVAASGVRLADGAYNYEVQVTPVVGPEAQAAFAAALESRDDAVVARLQAAGQLPTGPFVQAGTFAVMNGAVVAGDATIEPGEQARAGEATLDQVIADDLIVQGSECVGFDCINGENFGADTIRLKENNLRIHFEDTSGAGFPANDWRIVANDSAGGGANFLAVEDATAARQVFRLDAGAPTNSLFMDSSGRIGLGTSTPVLNLHIASGNTPAMRMEQNGTSGFTAYTWDVAGNEAGFFVRDVTAGSRLPFRILPGAPSNSLAVEGTGDVGVGTLSPNASLHVRRTDGTAQVLVEETSATGAPRDLVRLVNTNGNALMRFIRGDSATSDWKIGSRGANFSIDDSADGTAEFFVAANGNITILGTMTTGGPTCGAGCRQADLQVRSADVLDKLGGIPMLRWATTAAEANNPDAGEVPVTHLSPDLLSFHETYGLGVDGQSVAPLDVATVALASAQALNETVQQQQQLIEAQAAQIAALEARLAQVEAMAHSHTYLPSVQQ